MGSFLKKLKVPNTYVIIFSIILLCAVATWFVPGGEYVETVAADGGEVLEFRETQSVPQTWQVFSALFTGFGQQAGIIVFVLIIGGAFWVVNSTKAVDGGILSFINFAKSLEKYRFFRKIGVGNIVIVLIMLLFGLFGAVFGMSEETIAFVVIVVPLAISLGYDSIVGLCMVYLAAHVGFAGAMLNPFTIGIAQDMAGLPLFSGIEYRTFCWVVLMVFAIVFVLWYAARVKRNPARSVMYEADGYWRNSLNAGAGTGTGASESAAVSESDGAHGGAGGETSVREHAGKRAGHAGKRAWAVFVLVLASILLFSAYYAHSCTIRIGESEYHAPWLMWVAAGLFALSSFFALRSSSRSFILNLLWFTIIFLIIGVMGYGWYITEISALFLALAIASGIAAGYTPDNIVKEFMTGAKDIFSAALVIGLAAGIITILEDGRIIDTILHSLEESLDGSGKAGALASMYGIQAVINLAIPSASAKAALTMPIMAPFSDLIGLSRQATVLAFQFGDGFTNMITPCSGVLLAALSVARIPYAKWFKWVWKFILALLLLGFLLLLPPLFMALPGF